MLNSLQNPTTVFTVLHGMRFHRPLYKTYFVSEISFSRLSLLFNASEFEKLFIMRILSLIKLFHYNSFDLYKNTQ